MRKLISNLSLGLTILIACIVFVIFFLLLERDKTFEMANAIIMSSAAGAAFGLVQAAWDAMRFPIRKLRAGQVLNVANFLIAFGAIGVFGSRWLWRVLDRPDWLADHPIHGMALALMGIGCVLSLATVGSEDGEMTPAAWRDAAVVVAAGVLVSTIMFSTFR